jgi:hypothetical protein
MQHETKKIALIVNELTTLLLHMGNGNIEVKINRQKLATEIVMIQYQCNYEEVFVQNLRYDLNTQRQSEVEGYYWQLIGDDDDGEEISLVGAMIDEAVVEQKEGDLYIHIIRKNQH